MFPAHVDAPFRALAPEGKWGLSHEIPVSKASLYHGDNVVIGSGSVVTHDIPSNVIAAGNPCRVLRPLTDADRAHWQQEAARWRAACGR